MRMMVTDTKEQAETYSKFLKAAEEVAIAYGVPDGNMAQDISVAMRDIINEYLYTFCPYYPDSRVLPDEYGKCSLCGKHEA